MFTNKKKTKDAQKIADIINKNQCTYPNKNDCPHYMEIFNCCTKPSVLCEYRTSQQNIK